MASGVKKSGPFPAQAASPPVGTSRSSYFQNSPSPVVMSRGAASRKRAGTRSCQTLGGSSTWSSTEIIQSSEGVVMLLMWLLPLRLIGERSLRAKMTGPAREAQR